MTAATIPEMTRDAWEESITRLEIILADYEDENGAIPEHPALRNLTRFWDRLVCYGLEREWQDLHFADSINDNEMENAA